MKYFENLSKKSFTTTIGDFSISNFFSYIDITKESFVTDEITTDSKLNLLEQANVNYQDTNSFWIFLLANKTINPFNLLVENPNIFLNNNKDKVSLDLTNVISGSTNYVFPIGSIVVPYVQNSGSSSSYSSVGNFDLNSALTIIENSFYYDEDMILKQQKGGTTDFITISGTTQGVVIITPVKGGTYTIEKQYYPKNVIKAVEKVISVEAIDASAVELDENYLLSSISPKLSKTSTPKRISSSIEQIPGLSGGIEITALRDLELTKKIILGFIPTQIGSLKSYFVSTKYS